MKTNFKTYTLIFLFVILFQNSYSQQNTNGWYWINSQPQSNNINWSKVIDATHYYAVGNAGTFMKSSDGGDTWLINSQAGVSDPSFGSGAAFNLSTAWFFNPNTGFVAGQSQSGDGGKIKRTTDGGNTFTEISLGGGTGSPRVTDIFFINSTTGYLCGNNTIKAFKTTNAGLNWTLISNLPASTIDYTCLYAKDANNILIGTATDGSAGTRRIVRTTNAGATWKIDTIPGTTIHDITDIEFQNVNTGFVSGNANYFGFTTNGGNSWTQAIFPNSNNGIYKLQVIGSTVYALSSYYAYYYTSNLGVTWDSVKFDDPSNPYQPYPFLMTTFSFNGNDVMVAGYNGKINISNDGGASWRNKNYSVGNCSYPFSSIYAMPGTGQVWSGSNGGGMILYSTNRGANWTQQFTGASNAIYDIDMKTPTTGYATGGNAFAGVGYCYKTTNSGTTWSPLPIPAPFYQMNSASFVNVNTGWVVGGLPFNSGSEISKTTDGGATWTSQVTTPVFLSALGQVEMVDANTGYLCSGFNVWKTTNGGTNWNTITVSPSANWNKIKAFSAATVYIGGGQRVNKSTDGGTSWSSVTIPSTLANIFSMDWSDVNNGTVVGTQGYTAKTSNGGVNWVERNPGSSTLTGVSMVTKDTVYTVCDRNVFGAMFRLVDGNTGISFNLTVGIQGFWNGSTQVSDTVKCHLRNATFPFAEVEVAKAVLNSSGNAIFTFTSAPSGSYYLEITHRNSIETWSASPQPVVQGGSYNYNFTTSASQAFGNNLVLKSGKYCDYSGDVNQDGAVNLTDLLQTYNSASNFTTGYVAEDVNGDNIVDLSDITIIYNNASNFVAKVTP